MQLIDLFMVVVILTIPIIVIFDSHRQRQISYQLELFRTVVAVWDALDKEKRHFRDRKSASWPTRRRRNLRSDLGSARTGPRGSKGRPVPESQSAEGERLSERFARGDNSTVLHKIEDGVAWNVLGN